MSLTIVIDDSFLGEKFVLKQAIAHAVARTRKDLKELAKIYGKDNIPHKHLYDNALIHYKSLQKKLEPK